MKMARNRAARIVHNIRQNHQLFVRLVSFCGGSSKAASSCSSRFSSGWDANNGVSSVYGGGSRADDRLGDRGGVFDCDAGRAASEDMAPAVLDVHGERKEIEIAQ